MEVCRVALLKHNYTASIANNVILPIIYMVNIEIQYINQVDLPPYYRTTGIS